MNKFAASTGKRGISFITAAIIITAFIELFQHSGRQSPASVALRAEENLWNAEASVTKHLKALAGLTSDEAIKDYVFNQHNHFHNSVSTFVYYKDSLLAWSDNNILIFPEENDTASKNSFLTASYYANALCPTASVVRLKNGWYEVLKLNKDEYSFYSALLLKNEFAYQNKFLVNDFSQVLGISDNYNLSISADSNAIPIKSKVITSPGKIAFYISRGEETDTVKPFALSSWLYVLAIILFLAGIYYTGKYFLKKSFMLAFLFALVIIVLRCFMIRFHIPDELYTHNLFSPRLYAGYLYMNSLGDFLLNVLMVLCLLLIFLNPSKRTAADIREEQSAASPFALHPSLFTTYAIMLPVILLASAGLKTLMQGLVYDSDINFNLSNVFELNGFSLIGIVIIAILMLIQFLLVKAFVDFQRAVQLSKEKFKSHFFFIVILWILLICITVIAHHLPLAATAIFTALLYISIYIFSSTRPGSWYSVFANIIFLFLTSLYASSSIYYYSHIKDQEHRKLLASKIESEQDRIAEHVFEDVEDKISSDTTLQVYFHMYSSESNGIAEYGSRSLTLHSFSDGAEKKTTAGSSSKQSVDSQLPLTTATAYSQYPHPSVDGHPYSDTAQLPTADSQLRDRANAAALISQRLHRKYFNGYWTKYEIDCYCYDSYNHPLNKNLDSTSYSRFQSIISNVGKPTYAADLFFLTDPKGKSMYLAKIPLFSSESNGVKSLTRQSFSDSAEYGIKGVANPHPSVAGHPYSDTAQLPATDSQLIGTIFIELEPKLIQATQGFPELFISDKVPFNNDLANYSYAKYKNGELINRYGDFAYYFSASAFINSQESGAGSRSLTLHSFSDGAEKKTAVGSSSSSHQSSDSQLPLPTATANSQLYSFVNKDGYNHLLYRYNLSSDGSGLIVVSKKQDTAYTLVTSFSYLFAFFSILMLLFMIARNIVIGYSHFQFSFSLKNRIQVTVIAIVIFSVTVLGTGTVIYIINKYDSNQSLKISDELKTLLQTIENGLDEEQQNPDTALTDAVGQSRRLTESYEDMIYKLSTLSVNPSVNFNWYDTGGMLLYSSQPKIYDQGITSVLMNPKAYEELTVNKLTQYVHPENTGNLKYIAAYQALRNRNNRELGFISLPYFEKQNELNKDISTFLSALINIYVLLLALTLLLTFFIASLVTQPLLLIQEKLAHLHLGAHNETIQWSRNDEIGELVKAYNKKVEELAYSAELLAKSERESAWQEMAKQVAHEIKNPLTPMKLGIQHLLNAYSSRGSTPLDADPTGSTDQRDKDKEHQPTDELVKKICETLIQQVDTLTNIADAFSSFARMPQAKNEKLNLKSVLSDTISLFKHTPGVLIYFHPSTPLDADPTGSTDGCNVYADRDQLVRVFSNLFRNSIQSIPADREGKIEISLFRAHKSNPTEPYIPFRAEFGVGSREKERYDKNSQLPTPNSQLNNMVLTVAIKDNGSGIADNQLEKIFTPNFTTKTGGMGLGLAIVKNIVENLGGKVQFQTKIGFGSTFFVSLPAIE